MSRSKSGVSCSGTRTENFWTCSIQSAQWTAHLDWNDWLGLLREDHASVKEGRYDVVYEQVDACLVLLIELVVEHLPLHGATAQHSVDLPRLVVLEVLPNSLEDLFENIFAKLDHGLSLSVR